MTVPYIIAWIAWLIVAMVVLVAGMLTAKDDHKLAGSVVFPIAMFWPLTMIGMCAYLIIRATGIMDAEYERQQRPTKTARESNAVS